jgi:hypothetical protein
MDKKLRIRARRNGKGGICTRDKCMYVLLNSLIEKA